MVRRVAYLAVPVLLLVGLGGCALNIFNFERREAWRADSEQICMASRPFRRDDYIVQVRAINDQGVCGMERPLQVAALGDGTVVVGPTATIGCPMTVALEQWMAESVQPAAVAGFGAPVVAVRQISDYACRNRNGQAGADLSEHAFGNALDIAAFQLADGRVVTVEDGWNGSPEEREFLREVHATACRYFTTVLEPGVDYHNDHLHVDLAHHNSDGTSRYCRPTPVMPPPRLPVFNLPIAEVDAAAPPGIAEATPLAAATDTIATGALARIGKLIQALVD